MTGPGASALPETGTALLVIDMQVGLFGADTPRHDAEGVVERINALARAVRRAGGPSSSSSTTGLRRPLRARA